MLYRSTCIGLKWCAVRATIIELFFLIGYIFMTQMLIDNTSRTKSGDMIDEVSRKKEKRQSDSPIRYDSWFTNWLERWALFLIFNIRPKKANFLDNLVTSNSAINYITVLCHEWMRSFGCHTWHRFQSTQPFSTVPCFTTYSDQGEFAPFLNGISGFDRG